MIGDDGTAKADLAVSSSHLVLPAVLPDPLARPVTSCMDCGDPRCSGEHAPEDCPMRRDHIAELRYRITNDRQKLANLTKEAS